MKYYLRGGRKFKSLADIEEWLEKAEVPGFEKIGEIQLCPLTMKKMYNIKAQTTPHITVPIFVGDLDYLGLEGFAESASPQYVFLNIKYSKQELKYTLFHELMHLVLILHNVVLKSNLDERLVRETERLAFGCFSTMHYAGEEKRRRRQSADEKIKYIQRVIKNINRNQKKEPE